MTYIYSMNKVIIGKKAEKQLHKLPDYIVRKFQMWAIQVEMFSIREVRKIPGYHDEPLHGKRTGQRSIRLSKTYRAFYCEHGDNIIIEVIEVNNHEY